MRFSYDFEAESCIKKDIEDHAYRVLNREGFFETCHVQRFETLKKAEVMRRGLWKYLWGCAPIPLSPFQVEACHSWWYLGLVTEGCFLETAMSKGKLNQPNTLFISDYYKSLIRDIIFSALILLATQVRCRIGLNYIFVEEVDDVFNDSASALDLSAKFVRYDVQGEYRMDELEVRTRLKTLFSEIMSQPGFGAGPQAELDLFLKTFTHGCQNLNLNHNIKVYKSRLPTEWHYNVLFASKVERMEFIECLYALFISENCVVYCDETKDAFGKDWDVKLSSLYYQLIGDEGWKRDGSNNWMKKRDVSFSGVNVEDVEMKRCIASIREMYRSFVNFEECNMETELKRVDKLVGFIHEIFPCHIAALARGASVLKWPCTMDFQKGAGYWTISDILETGLPLPVSTPNLV